MNSRQVIHRSTAYLFLRIIVLETCLEAVYLMGRFAVERIGVAVGYTDVVWFGPVIQFWVFVAQMAILGYLLARWSNDTVILKQTEMVVNSGWLQRRSVAYPYQNMQQITVHESAIGQLFGAGKVSVYIPAIGHDIILAEMPHPHDLAESLKQMQPDESQNQFIIKR